MKVLFICTCNVFRSTIAEKCLTNYLDNNSIYNIRVNSAGTRLNINGVSNFTKFRRNEKGIDFKHTYKKRVLPS